MRIGFYPGTFDPVTLGHSDIIRRALKLVDKLVIGVAINRDKGPLLSLEERVDLILKDAELLYPEGKCRIEVEPFEDLLMDRAEKVGASVIVRGLRAVSDFEYEFQMAQMNRRLTGDVETLFLMASEDYTYLSSRLVKEVALLGGDVSGLVTAEVARALEAKRAERPT